MTTHKVRRDIANLEGGYIARIVSIINPINTTDKEYEYVRQEYYNYMQLLHENFRLDDFEVEEYANRMLDRMYVIKEDMAKEELLNQRAKQVWSLRRQAKLLQQQ